MKPSITTDYDMHLQAKVFHLIIPDSYIISTKHPNFKICYWLIRLALKEFFDKK